VFDLRYHVASLAAVFVALAVGIVIGVAIAGGGSLEETTQGIRQDQLDALRADLEEARAQADGVEEERAALEDVLQGVYPELMAGRLAGKLVALLFLGPLDGATNSAVEKTLADADASGGLAGPGSPTRVTALQLPIDVDGINGLLEDEPALAGYIGDARLGELGVALGRELVRGGETPLWDLLATQVVEARSGSLDEPVDAVVVVRTWNPEPSTDPAKEGRRSQSEALVVGLLQGVGEAGLPVIGVEKASQDPSTVELFRLVSGVSSVDDVDTLPGRLALALLLAGGDPGHYGTKETADAVVPRIEPLIVPSPVSG
jgi:hypothetical protein